MNLNISQNVFLIDMSEDKYSILDDLLSSFSYFKCRRHAFHLQYIHVKAKPNQKGVSPEVDGESSVRQQVDDSIMIILINMIWQNDLL